MSLLDDVCADAGFAGKVEAAIAEKILKGSQGKEISTADGTYSLQVTEVVIDELDIVADEDSGEDLEADISVTGTSKVTGIYLDSDGDDGDAEDEEGRFEAGIRVRFPSNTLSADLKEIVEQIDIDQDDITISVSSDEDDID